MQNRDWLPIGIALLAFAYAFSQRSATVSTPEGSMTVDHKADGSSSRTFTFKDGKILTLNTIPGKIPDDYPKDMPVYPGAKSELANASPEGKAVTVLLTSNDTADKIIEFYRKGLDANGWKMESATVTAEVTTLTAVKENRQATVTVISTAYGRSIAQVLLDR